MIENWYCVSAMSFALRIMFMTSLLACAGCGANGEAEGGGYGNGAHGHVKVGVPF
jgi:hypothetical protein